MASPSPETVAIWRGRPLFTFAAFGSVGIAATILYFVLANAFAAFPGVASTVASVGAYALCAIFSYTAHKHVSFASKRANAVAVPRFLVATAVGLAISYAIPAIGWRLGIPSYASFATICVIVPAINFVVLSRWVFGDDSIKSSTRPLIPAFWGSCALIVALVGFIGWFFIAWRWGTNPDTSWLITVIEQISGGARPYVDIIEVNPPFSIWLFFPPVHVAGLLGIAPEIAVRFYTILICLAGTSLMGWMLASGRLLNRRSAVVISVALFSITVLMSGNSFAERDQIGAVFALPLLVLSAWRARPERGMPPSFRHWAVAGAGAGVMALVKPHYAVVVFSVAFMLAFRRRDLRIMLLPEFVLSGIITVAYLASVYLLYPVFFEELLPLLQETYMAFRQPPGLLLWMGLPWLALPVAYGLQRPPYRLPAASDFLMVAAFAAWIPFFWQGKGWPYHMYAAVLFGSAALLVRLAELFENRPSEPRLRHVVVVSVAILTAHLRFVPTEKPADALVAAGLGLGPKPTIGMLGGGIETGHPLARMIGGSWTDPYCSDWIPVYARRLESKFAAIDRQQADRFRTMAEDYYARKKERLMRNPPSVLIVDGNGRPFSEMIGTFGFDALLARYDRVAAVDGVDLYRLRKKSLPIMPPGGPSPGAASG